MTVGVFRYLMDAANLLFGDPDGARRILRLSSIPPNVLSGSVVSASPSVAVAVCWLLLQLVVPLRPYLYPGDPLWTQRGHQFSWRLLLRDKEGSLSFIARDGPDGSERAFDPRDELLGFQIKALQGDPELIRQYARQLSWRLRAEGWRRPEVHALAKLSLNARPPAPLIDPAIDLASDSLCAGWILPSPRRQDRQRSR
jgi:hypothetical protein